MIRFNHVAMRYADSEDVLKDVTFHLPRGSFHFLTGPSGSGKTSLLRLLALSHAPSSGTITFLGRDLADVGRDELPDLRRRIGMVFQDFRLLDHLTVFQNVALPLRMQGEKTSHIRAKVMELLTWLELEDHADFHPHILSGGQQQKVAIARAVINRPDLLLADEPTGNLDPELSRKLLYLFEALNSWGTTIVIATHDIALIQALKKPVLQLENGDVTYFEDPVYKAPTAIKVPPLPKMLAPDPA